MFTMWNTKDVKLPRMEDAHDFSHLCTDRSRGLGPRPPLATWHAGAAECAFATAEGGVMSMWAPFVLPVHVHPDIYCATLREMATVGGGASVDLAPF